MATATAVTPTLTSEIEDAVLVVTIDAPGESVNTLGPALGEELAALVARVERDALITGVVMISGKSDSFIVGADIEQFLEFRSAADAERLTRTGQELLGRVERLRAPVVAAIHGACLGGGLEVALACRYRICSDYPKTML